jgi:outer membrane protein assembly factor BamB
LDSELEWGVASSVLLHQGMVIVQCDVSDSPFIVALDVETGREIWRTEGDEYPSWSTPAVFEEQGHSVLVVVAPNHVRGLDAATGEEFWRLYWGMDITTPAPVVSPDLIYVSAGKGRWRPIVAIRRGARGDITLDGGQTHNRYVAWSLKRGGPITPTPLFYRGRLYVLEDMGILSCYDGTSGERLYRERVPGDYFASPVTSGGMIYLTNRAGEVHVVKAGPDFEMLAKSSLGQPTVATPAISAGTLYFRTVQDLLAIRPGAGSASGVDLEEDSRCPRTASP